MINNIKIYNFNIKLRKVNESSRSDARVFTLIKQSINGKVIGYDLGKYLEETPIDSRMLSKEKEEIGKKLKRVKKGKSYELLSKNFENFEEMVQKYNDILLGLGPKGSGKKDLDLLEIKLLYLIIELRVNLGMELYDISSKDVKKYIDAVTFDIMNERYESLSILKHVDEEKVELTLK